MSKRSPPFLLWDSCPRGSRGWGGGDRENDIADTIIILNGVPIRARDNGDGTYSLVVSKVPSAAIHLESSGSGAGNETDIRYYPEDGVVPEGEMHYITCVAFEDEDNTPTEVQIGIRRGAALVRKCEQASPTAGKTYWHNDEIMLQGGDRLEVYFSGAIGGDSLLAWFHGYK